MTKPESDSTGTEESTKRRVLPGPLSSTWTFLLFGILSLMVVAEPVSAQTQAGGGLCGTEGGQSLINGIIRFVTSVGLIGGFLSWQGTNLLGIFSFTQEAKKKLKQKQRSIAKYSILFIAGPILFKAILSEIGIGIADCIDVVPYF
ncbi:hypothetical protein [Halobacterium rubrum]|uniref:hypothetical protein n=1 Tax=Halobacterium TaxID=2239 RepID=UPI001F422981|nr:MULTISPECIES: hypothetical protein [Halobacterium]MDH5021710.1 hypothetical protein [Halobacterium rubrum]